MHDQNMYNDFFSFKPKMLELITNLKVVVIVLKLKPSSFT